MRGAFSGKGKLPPVGINARLKPRDDSRELAAEFATSYDIDGERTLSSGFVAGTLLFSGKYRAGSFLWQLNKKEKKGGRKKERGTAFSKVHPLVGLEKRPVYKD